MFSSFFLSADSSIFFFSLVGNFRWFSRVLSFTLFFSKYYLRFLRSSFFSADSFLFHFIPIHSYSYRIVALEFCLQFFSMSLSVSSCFDVFAWPVFVVVVVSFDLWNGFVFQNPFEIHGVYVCECAFIRMRWTKKKKKRGEITRQERDIYTHGILVHSWHTYGQCNRLLYPQWNFDSIGLFHQMPSGGPIVFNFHAVCNCLLTQIFWFGV